MVVYLWTEVLKFDLCLEVWERWPTAPNLSIAFHVSFYNFISWRWSMWGFVIGTFTPHGFKFLRCVFKFMRVRLSVHLLWRKHCPYNTIYFGPILYLWPFFFFSILEIIFLEASRDTHCYCVPSATSFVYSFFLNKDLCMGPEF